jgi:SAM-dependent methyltransferase
MFSFDKLLHMADNANITINSYDKFSNEYFRRSQKLFRPDDIEKFLSLIKPKSLILDAGCAFGRDSKAFIEKGNKVVGIDLSRKLLNIAKEFVSQLDTRLMDIRKIEFPDNHFDAVWSSASVHHVSLKEGKQVIMKFYNILKNDGILYLLTRMGNGEDIIEDKEIKGFKRYFSYFSEKELTNYINSLGFTILEKHIYNEHRQFHTDNDIDYLVVFAKKQV